MLQSHATLTIGASAIQLSTALVNPNAFMASKIRIQVKEGSMGPVFVGPSTVTSAGVNADETLEIAGAGKASVQFVEEDQSNLNSIDTRAYWVHGAVPGDTLAVEIEQN